MNKLIKVTRAFFSALKAGIKSSVKQYRRLHEIAATSEPTKAELEFIDSRPVDYEDIKSRFDK